MADAHSTFGDDYAGAGIDNPDRGQLVIFTTRADDRGERIRGRARDPQYVEIREVSRSMNDLSQILERVLAEAGTTADGRFAVDVSVDVMRNLVHARIPPSLETEKRDRSGRWKA